MKPTEPPTPTQVIGGIVFFLVMVFCVVVFIGGREQAKRSCAINYDIC